MRYRKKKNEVCLPVPQKYMQTLQDSLPDVPMAKVEKTIKKKTN